MHVYYTTRSRVDHELKKESFTIIKVGFSAFELSIAVEQRQTSHHITRPLPHSWEKSQCLSVSMDSPTKGLAPAGSEVQD
jgi:hypothetical protein